MRYDILIILDALRQVLSFSVIGLLQIQGGEVFLYPDLAELLDFVLESKMVNRVHIATNGTLMPNVGLDLLRDPKLHVRISDYKHLSLKSAELKEYLDRNNVSNSMYSFASHIGLWYKLDGEQYGIERYDTAHKFSNCVFRGCLTLENGVIGRCSRAVIAQQIQGFSANDGDFLIVDKSDDFGRRLMEYVNPPPPPLHASLLSLQRFIR
jgi:hypothetical protein